jgi:RimJ/RimL family protein N-acetyltransferase
MGLVPHLTTERLLLREARRSDFDQYATIVMDPKRATPPGAVDRRTAWRMFTASQGSWIVDGIGAWAIEHRESGAFVGTIGAFYREPPPGPNEESDDLEIGWTLVEQHRGRGFATEAARAVVQYALPARNAVRIVAHVDHDNPASIRVAEKLGMRYEREVPWYFETRLRRYVLDAASVV